MLLPKLTLSRLEELRLLNDERKILLPANANPTPEPEAKANGGDTKMTDVEEHVAEEEDDAMDTDDDIHQGRSLRGGSDRAAERQRKREEEQERREKAEAAAKMPKQSKQVTRLLKDIQKKQDAIKQCEDEIAVIDNDLREADCPRTRVLGKDRFWNRYYWFERNGMPYAGLPDSSTAEAGYANGCLWVQGPDEMEREGFIDMKREWQAEYEAQFGMSVPERKRREEGATSVFGAQQWAYYDTPAAVDALVEWLDPRGNNELRLQKELKACQEKMKELMERRRAHLQPTEEEEGKRASTRVKGLAPRCLAWHNGMAVEELGHLHSEQPRSRKPTRKEKERERRR